MQKQKRWNPPSVVAILVLLTGVFGIVTFVTSGVAVFLSLQAQVPQTLPLFWLRVGFFTGIVDGTLLIMWLFKEIF